MKKLIFVLMIVVGIQSVSASLVVDPQYQFVLEKTRIDTVQVCDTTYEKRVTDKTTTDYAVEYVMKCNVRCTTEVRTVVVWAVDVPEMVDVSALKSFRCREKRWDEMNNYVPCNIIGTRIGD